MKGLKSILAVLAAMTMTIGSVSINAYAEDAPETAVVGTEAEALAHFSLKELFDMSDEKFFGLSGRMGNGKEYYDTVKKDAERVTKVYGITEYGGISGRLSVMLPMDDSTYKDGDTEETIKNYLGDTVQYKISSPSFSGEYYSNILTVSFPGYEISAESNEITDKQILEFAKCWFCVDHIYNINYEEYGSAYSNDEKNGVFLKGDADLNGTVDLADLTTVAKYNLNNEAYPLANDVAYKNSDMNDDGKVDGLDTSVLIEKQLGREPSVREYINVPQNGKTTELTANLKPVSVQSAKPSEKFEKSQTEFALSMLKNSMTEEGNTLVSPYSAVQALAMTANGADSNTLKEMMSAIGGGMSIDEFNKYMAGYNKELPKDENCNIMNANSIWYNNDKNAFSPEKNFLVNNKSIYGADAFAAPMNSETVNDVNSWVNKHTDGMIPKIINNFQPETVMALVNAVTFNAKWSNPYTGTYDSKGFFNSADSKKQDAQVLSAKSVMPYFESKDAKGFLKYYMGGRYAFAAILPNTDTSIYKYVQDLTADKFTKLISSAKNETVQSKMPKFTTDFSVKLNEPLKAMGINDAFDENKANFTKMGRSDYGNISISQVLQKTHIDVDSEGTKAAAATVVVMTYPTCAIIEPEPKEVMLDRPFVYAIVDTRTNIPIFMGTLLTLEN